jgi:3-dehydroquinate synthase
MDRVYRLSDRNSEVRFVSSEDELELLIGQEKERLSLWCADANSARYLPQSVPREQTFIIEAGESYKKIETVLRMVDFALDAGAGRDVRFYALGGGVICDMAAFAASIYMRGVEVVLVPTTLLGMVDATLGGKSGVDYRGYKNILGSFHPASLIIIDPRFLKTLPDSEMMSGFAELIKHAMLSGNDALGELEEALPAVLGRDSRVLTRIISTSLNIKGRVIEQDPFEKGIRAHLNLGHTFGHALESACGFSGWSHGDAVAWGLSRALHAGVLLGITDGSYRERIDKLLDRFGYRRTAEADPGKIIGAVGSDKKKKGGEVYFVLQRRAGDTLTRPLPREVLEETVRSGCTVAGR